MKKTRHSAIQFIIGEVDGEMTANGWHNRQGIGFLKKNKAEVYANQILQREGQVYIKVRYGKEFTNDVIAYNKKEIRQTFASFTEQDLIDYFMKGI